MRRALGVLLALLLAFAACDGDDEGGSEGTTTVPTARPTTTAPADPFAVPAVIDEAYAQKVIDKLYEIEADAARTIVAEGEIVRPAAEKLRSVFGDYQLNQELEVWNSSVRSRFSDMRRPPGTVAVTVDRLVRANAECIHIRTRVDVSARYVEPGGPFTLFTVLSRGEPDRTAISGSPWVVRYQGAGGPSGEPLAFDPCDSLPSS